MYFLQTGACLVWRRSLFSRNERPIASLRANDHFGEISMLFECPTFAKVQSCNFSLLGRLNKRNFATIIQAFPGLRRSIWEKVMSYRSKWQVRLESVLRQTEYFEEIAPAAITRLIYQSALLQFDPDTCLFKQGEQAKGLWVVISGSVALEVRVGCLQVPMVLLKPGAVINYDTATLCSLTSFASRREQQCTARALDFVSCAFLDFDRIAHEAFKSPFLASQLSRVARYVNKQMNRPYPLDYFEGTIVKNSKPVIIGATLHIARKRSRMKQYSMEEVEEDEIEGSFEAPEQFQSSSNCTADNNRLTVEIQEQRRRSSLFSNIGTGSIELPGKRAAKAAPGNRSGLFKLRNAVISLILVNRKILKDNPLSKLVSLQMNHEREGGQGPVFSK